MTTSTPEHRTGSPASPDPTERVGAAFFDVDRTLIAGGAALKLAGPFRRHGLITRRQQVRAAVMQLGFMLRGADDTGIERFAAAAEALIKGWDQAEVERIVGEELERHIHPMVYREALERIELHHQLGQPVYAVSATMREIVDPLSLLLGLDGGIGSDMEVVDGRFTGKIARVSHGPAKAERLVEFAERHGIDLARSSAYSDSISDEPFLRAVGRPYAVNPDKELRKLAEQEGWGILFFRTRMEIPLHHRTSTRVAALAVLAGVATAVGVSRRRSR